MLIGEFSLFHSQGGGNEKHQVGDQDRWRVWGSDSYRLRIALKAISTPDFTNGSTFYHHVDVAPKWATGKSYIGRYGSHLFYRHNNTPLSATAF